MQRGTNDTGLSIEGGEAVTQVASGSNPASLFK